MRILHKVRKLGWIEFALKIIIELLIPKRRGGLMSRTFLRWLTKTSRCTYATEIKAQHHGVYSFLLKDVQYK